MGKRRRGVLKLCNEVVCPRAFDFDENAVAVVADEARELKARGETIGERSKSDALDDPSHPHSQASRVSSVRRKRQRHVLAVAAAWRIAEASIQATKAETPSPVLADTSSV